jgi:hypothetical protein
MKAETEGRQQGELWGSCLSPIFPRILWQSWLLVTGHTGLQAPCRQGEELQYPQKSVFGRGQKELRLCGVNAPGWALKGCVSGKHRSIWRPSSQRLAKDLWLDCSIGGSAAWRGQRSYSVSLAWPGPGQGLLPTAHVRKLGHRRPLSSEWGRLSSKFASIECPGFPRRYLPLGNL